MRELTLLETGCLVGLLLLSLVLPLWISFRGRREGAIRRADVRTVLIGQLLGAGAGVAILVSSAVTPYAVTFAGVSCLVCAWLLFRRGRSKTTA